MTIYYDYMFPNRAIDALKESIKDSNVKGFFPYGFLEDLIDYFCNGNGNGNGYESTISELEYENERLENEIVSMEYKINELEEEIEELNSKLESLET